MRSLRSDRNTARRSNSIDRRTFLSSSTIATVAALLGELSCDSRLAVAQILRHPLPMTGPFQFNRTADQNLVQRVMGGTLSVVRSEAAGLNSTGTSAIPDYLYLYYDTDKNVFVHPTYEDIRTLDNKPYVTEPRVYSFNIGSADQPRLVGLKNQLQVNFSAAAPTELLGTLENLTWTFINAVDISGGKISFIDNAGGTQKDGVSLNSDPKIHVTQGTMSLAVQVSGQKRDSLWDKIIQFVTSAMKSPIISKVSQGFGIPAMPAVATDFVSHVLTAIEKSNHLEPLWSLPAIPFVVDKNKRRDPWVPTMRPGLWVIVDNKYATTTRNLKGHTLDFGSETFFRINNAAGEPIDQNYFIVGLDFTPESSNSSVLQHYPE